MKINQVIEVKPTRTEKDFLRLVLREVATTKGAPLEVAEKIEFGEVKHTIAYVYYADYREEVEYSATIGYETVIRKNGHSSKTGYIQWQEEPYFGKPSFDKVHISVLKNKDSGLYNWGNDSKWAQDYLIKSISNDESNSSTEMINEEVQIPSELTFIPKEVVNPEFSEDQMDLFKVFGYESLVGKMPGGEQTNVKILSQKTELIKETVYKLHSYEVSYTYDGKTYYAKARAIKGCDEVLLASDESSSVPTGLDLDLIDTLAAKEKPFLILAHASWILAYASTLITLISSTLWFIPVIFMVLALTVTKVCNVMCEKKSEQIKTEYNVTHVSTIIMTSLRRAIERLDLGELTDAEATEAEETIKNTEIKYPVESDVSIGPKLGISIAATIIVYIVSVAIQVL